MLDDIAKQRILARIRKSPMSTVALWHNLHHNEAFTGISWGTVIEHHIYGYLCDTPPLCRASVENEECTSEWDDADWDWFAAAILQVEGELPDYDDWKREHPKHPVGELQFASWAPVRRYLTDGNHLREHMERTFAAPHRRERELARRISHAGIQGELVCLEKDPLFGDKWVCPKCKGTFSVHHSPTPARCPFCDFPQSDSTGQVGAAT